jgi:maleylacetoacetate isomerase
VKGVVLYHYWRSSASWRVRWGLALKGISHEEVAVNLLTAEEKEREYKDRNPAGYVPCLVVDGKPPLGESLAILEWLEENFPEPSFFDGDSYRRALIRQLAETVNAGTQPLQNLDVMKRVSDDKEQQVAWVRHWIERGLGVYEELLSRAGREGRKFSVSDHPTLADLCLIPQCYASLRFQVDLRKYPQIQSIYEHALTTEACAASAPERFQPRA